MKTKSITQRMLFNDTTSQTGLVEQWDLWTETVCFYCWFCVASITLTGDELKRLSAKSWKNLRDRNCDGGFAYVMGFNGNCYELFNEIRDELGV